MTKITRRGFLKGTGMAALCNGFHFIFTTLDCQ